MLSFPRSLRSPRSYLSAGIAALTLLCGAAAAGDRADRPDISGYALKGRIVTLNASREVIDDGVVWIQNGTIKGILRTAEERASLPPDVPLVDTGGIIYPGLIDLHNHPEYAIYPLLPIKKRYKDRYEWRFYDDEYARRITHLNTLLTQPQYLDLGLEVGRYGELRALMGGTTALQGGRVAQPYAKEECLVRNIETTAAAPRAAFSRVDIGRDAKEWERMADEKSRGFLVVHLAEGVGPRMASEFDYIKRSGLLGPELIAIHGVGLTEAQMKELAAAGGKLVWSPLSNFLLYGQTADVAAARRAGLPLSLAPDWGPSGSKSILGELKVADLVNKHRLQTLFSDRELVEMVTTQPARALGWQERLGQVAEGYLADLLVVAARRSDPYRNLIESIEEDIVLITVRGDALYGDAATMQRLRAPQDLETLPPVRGKSFAIAPHCPGTSLPRLSVEDTLTRIQQGLNLAPSLLAKRISIEQYTRDFAVCGAGRPADPPSEQDARTLLACRFQHPYREKLSPPITSADREFFPRLLRNPNLPGYLKALPSYYRR